MLLLLPGESDRIWAYSWTHQQRKEKALTFQLAPWLAVPFIASFLSKSTHKPLIRYFYDALFVVAFPEIQSFSRSSLCEAVYVHMFICVAILSTILLLGSEFTFCLPLCGDTV